MDPRREGQKAEPSPGDKPHSTAPARGREEPSTGTAAARSRNRHSVDGLALSRVSPRRAAFRVTQPPGPEHESRGQVRGSTRDPHDEPAKLLLLERCQAEADGPAAVDAVLHPRRER